MSLNIVKMAREAGFHVGDQFAAGCSEDDLRKLAIIIIREFNENYPPPHPVAEPHKPLTDEEIAKCYETTGHYQTLRPQDRFAVFALARAIEAAHGIKGEA